MVKLMPVFLSCCCAFLLSLPFVLPHSLWKGAVHPQNVADFKPRDSWCPVYACQAVFSEESPAFGHKTKSHGMHSAKQLSVVRNELSASRVIAVLDGNTIRPCLSRRGKVEPALLQAQTCKSTSFSCSECPCDLAGLPACGVCLYVATFTAFMNTTTWFSRSSG